MIYHQIPIRNHSHVIPRSLRWSVRVPPVACCVATSRAIADQMWTQLCAAQMRPEMIGTPWIFSPENGFGKNLRFFTPVGSSHDIGE